jgi:hypothetical protein
LKRDVVTETSEIKLTVTTASGIISHTLIQKFSLNITEDRDSCRVGIDSD